MSANPTTTETKMTTETRSDYMTRAARQTAKMSDRAIDHQLTTAGGRWAEALEAELESRSGHSFNAYNTCIHCGADLHETADDRGIETICPR